MVPQGITADHLCRGTPGRRSLRFNQSGGSSRQLEFKNRNKLLIKKILTFVPPTAPYNPHCMSTRRLQSFPMPKNTYGEGTHLEIDRLLVLGQVRTWYVPNVFHHPQRLCKCSDIYIYTYHIGTDKTISASIKRLVLIWYPTLFHHCLLSLVLTYNQEHDALTASWEHKGT